MPNTADVQVLRRPGLLEQNSTIRHALGFYKAVGHIARYHPPPTTDLTPSRLYAALKTVVSTHTSLGVSVVDELSPSSHFVCLSGIDLREIVTFESVETGAARDCALSDAIERGLSTSFSDLGRLPLWRLLVLVPPDATPQSEAGVDVALFIHHGIADGGSATTFHKTLLAALRSTPLENTDTDPIIQVPKRDLLPPLESLLALPVSPWTLLRAFRGLWFPPSAKARWTGAPVTRPGPEGVRTQHAFSALEPPTVAGLLRACKRYKTSMTALLEVVLAQALFEALPADGTADELTCSCPIDLRRFMSLAPPLNPADTMGVFVASDEHVFRRAVERSHASLWADAVRVKACIDAKLATGSRDLNVGMLRYVSDLQAFFNRKVGKKRDQSFEVSNVGVVDAGEGQAQWSVSRMMFAQSASVGGAVLAFSVCSVKGGTMCVSASWQEGIAEKGFVEGVLRGFERLVEEMAREG